MAAVSFALVIGRSQHPVIVIAAVSSSLTEDYHFQLVDARVRVNALFDPGIPAVAGTIASPDGRRVLVDTLRGYYLIDWQERTVEHIDTVYEERENPAWSPDSQWIMFRRRNITGEEATPHLYDVQTRAMKQPTARRGYGWQWQPNSDHGVVVIAENDLWQVQISGSDAALLAEDVRSLVWSPDASKIAFARDGHYHVIDLESGETQTIPQENPTFMSWSPDGRWLVLAVGRRSQPIPFTYDLHTGAVHTFDFEPAQQVRMIRWSPDSQWMTMVIEPFGSVGATVQYQLYVTDPGGEQLHLVSSSGDNPQWSPDGRMLLYESIEVINGARYNRLYIVENDGIFTHSRRLADDAALPQWAQDSQHIIFIQSNSQRTESQLFMVSVSGNITRLLPGTGDLIRSFAYWN